MFPAHFLISMTCPYFEEANWNRNKCYLSPFFIVLVIFLSIQEFFESVLDRYFIFLQIFLLIFAGATAFLIWKNTVPSRPPKY